MEAISQSGDDPIPLLISVGVSDDDQISRLEIRNNLGQGINHSNKDRHADVADLLGVIAKRTWQKSAPQDHPETSFRSVLIGEEGLNTITAPIRTQRGDIVVFKTPNAVERDGFRTFNLDQIFRELSVLNFLKNEDAIARFRRIVWEVRGPVDNLTILPAIETERAIADLAAFCDDGQQRSLEVRLRLCQDIIEGLRNIHHWKILHGTCTFR